MVVQTTLKFLHAEIILNREIYLWIVWAFLQENPVSRCSQRRGCSPPKKQPRPPNSPQSEQKCIHRSQMDLSMVSEQTKLWKESKGKLLHYFLGVLEITSYRETLQKMVCLSLSFLFSLCSVLLTLWSREEFKANSCYKNRQKALTWNFWHQQTYLYV